LKDGKNNKFKLNIRVSLEEKKSARFQHITACSRFGRSTALSQIAFASTLWQLRLHAERYMQLSDYQSIGGAAGFLPASEERFALCKTERNGEEGIYC
jgi:hypothetical protein